MTIHLELYDKIEENVFLHFKVVDSGVGIDKEVASKLFVMYGQASASDYRKYGGTGIGLRLCSLLVQQAMGGSIGMDSIKGKGATAWFTISLPVGAPPVSQNQLTGKEGEAPGQPQAADEVEPMLVLVVDDIPLNRDIAVTILSRENCICDTACDGMEAVAAFKRKQYDLVVLDIQVRTSPELSVRSLVLTLIHTDA